MTAAIRRFFALPAAASVVLPLSTTAAAAPQPADIVRHPYVAAFSRVSDDGRVYFCAGTLVAPRWILSAAHCFDSRRTGRIPDREIQAMVGRASLKQAEAGAQMRVDRVILHPGYDPETQQNDLALVRLDEVAGPLIAEAAGPASDPDAATALGFGSLFEGSLAGRALTSTGAPAALAFDRLLRARLSFVHPAECAQVGGSPEMGIGLCLTAAAADACVGDSGGPLIGENDAGTDRLLGVLSSGSGCAVAEPRIAYTRVAPYARWIAATIAAD